MAQVVIGVRQSSKSIVNLYQSMMNKAGKKPITAEKALLRVASLCATSEQAESDIHAKLLKWGIAPGDAQAIIARLKKEDYLNEERYARAYCRDKFRFNGWGRIKIAFMLRSKGVNTSCIDRVTAEIDDKAYRATLEKLLKAKWREVQDKDLRQARASMMRFATGRGFEPEVFYPMISTIAQKTVQPQ